MTEQEWLERQADQWMRNQDITPTFSPDLPSVSECGWRVVPAPLSRPLYERIKHADEVEFYAVFGGREVTARRPLASHSIVQASSSSASGNVRAGHACPQVIHSLPVSSTACGAGSARPRIRLTP